MMLNIKYTDNPKSSELVIFDILDSNWNLAGAKGWINEVLGFFWEWQTQLQNQAFPKSLDTSRCSRQSCSYYTQGSLQAGNSFLSSDNPVFQPTKSRFQTFHFQSTYEAWFSFWPDLWGHFQIVNCLFWFPFLLFKEGKGLTHISPAWINYRKLRYCHKKVCYGIMWALMFNQTHTPCHTEFNVLILVYLQFQNGHKIAYL